MKLGLFHEHQPPQPWLEGSDQKPFNDALDPVEPAGITDLWKRFLTRSIGVVLEGRPGKSYALARGTFGDPTRGGAIPRVSRETLAKDAKLA